MFSPGIWFFINRCPFIFTLSAIVVAICRYYALTYWVLLPTVILALPARFSILILWQHIRDARDAARLGARPVPCVRGKSWHCLDVARDIHTKSEADYLDEALLPYIEKYGEIVNFKVLGTHSLFTTSPEHIKNILATNFNSFAKGPVFQGTMSSVLGQGVFNSDGDMWKFHRSLSRPFFTRDRISDFEIFDRHAELAIKKMKTRLRSGVPIDFQDLCTRFTLDSACEFLFGARIHSILGDLPYPFNFDPSSQKRFSADSDNDDAEITDGLLFKPMVRIEQFSEALKNAQSTLMRRLRLGDIWPLTEMSKDHTWEAMKVVSSFIDPIVNAALEKRKDCETGVKVEPEEETLLDHLVKETDDPKVIKDETLNILIAGRDTTAITLTFVVYFLAMYPDVMDRLREEVLAKVGSTERPTYAMITEMKYLRAVINETLRLYPAVPENVRETVKATTFPSSNPSEKPLLIPTGSEISYSVFMMHRRKDLWGPDAESFDPNRFLDSRLQKYLLPNPMIFLPFNAGPRICLGQQFAYSELSFIIIRLVQNFDRFELVQEECARPETLPKLSEWRESGQGRRKSVERVWAKRLLTLYCNGGLWIQAREAEGDSDV